MAKAHSRWKVLPHAPIEKLTTNLWRVEGELPNMPLKRVMTVAKRADGALVVHNAIALEDAAMAEIDAWGKVAYVVVPNGYHRIDAPPFAARYPEARFYAPSGARAKAEEVTPIHGVYEEFPADDDVRLVALDGVAGGEGVMIVKTGDEVTLVLNDAVFNMPHVPGVQGFFLRHVTQSSGGPRISRVARWLIIKDRAAFKAHLARLAETPGLRRVIVSHHETIDVDPAGVLRKLAAEL